MTLDALAGRRERPRLFRLAVTVAIRSPEWLGLTCSTCGSKLLQAFRTVDGDATVEADWRNDLTRSSISTITTIVVKREHTPSQSATVASERASQEGPIKTVSAMYALD